MTTAPTTTPKPRRRWFQFSLRTMLVLMLAFGCGFGWLGMKVKQAREQREAVKAIEKLGGRVGSSGDMIRTPVAWVGTLLGEDLPVNVTGVDFRKPQVQVTDAGLAHLRGLTKLQSLGLSRAQVTDAGVNELRNAVPRVRVLR